MSMDLSFLEKFTGGDTLKMKKYIALYLDTATVLFNSIGEGIAAEDWEKVCANVHSLKPQITYMGLTNLSELLLKIEEKSKAQDTYSINEIFEQALVVHRQSKQVLEGYLET